MARNIPNECCSINFLYFFIFFFVWVLSEIGPEKRSRTQGKIIHLEDVPESMSEIEWDKDRGKANMSVCYKDHSQLGPYTEGTSKRQRECLPECLCAGLEAGAIGWGLSGGVNSPILVGCTCLLAKVIPVIWKCVPRWKVKRDYLVVMVGHC